MKEKLLHPVIHDMVINGHIVHTENPEDDYDYEYGRWEAPLSAPQIELLREALVEGHWYSFGATIVVNDPGLSHPNEIHLNPNEFRYYFDGTSLCEEEIGFINLFTPNSKFVGPGNAWQFVEDFELDIYEEPSNTK